MSLNPLILFNLSLGPTHVRGHTLDLVFTLSLNTDSVCCEDLHVTDHECILSNMSVTLNYLPTKRVLRSRMINGLSAEKQAYMQKGEATVEKHQATSLSHLFERPFN